VSYAALCSWMGYKIYDKIKDKNCFGLLISSDATEGFVSYQTAGSGGSMLIGTFYRHQIIPKGSLSSMAQYLPFH
jgi:hypothetical protein